MDRNSSLIVAAALAIIVTQVAVGGWVVSAIRDVRIAVTYGPSYDERLSEMARVLEQVAENTESIDERLMTPAEYIARKAPRSVIRLPDYHPAPDQSVDSQ